MHASKTVYLLVPNPGINSRIPGLAFLNPETRDWKMVPGLQSLLAVWWYGFVLLVVLTMRHCIIVDEGLAFMCKYVFNFHLYLTD